MANWKNKIDISEQFRKYQNKEITVNDVIDSLVAELSKIRPVYNFINGIILKLKELKETTYEEEEKEEGFDCILESLYDWGDRGNRLWIGTM